MTIAQALKYSTERFKHSNSSSPALDSEVLLGIAIKKGKQFLFTRPEKKLTKKEAGRFLDFVNKRSKGIPVAYLTGQKEFYGLDFYINKHVLVPRPETETLVEVALEKIKSSRSGLKILDVGTGSGCVIIAIAKTASARQKTASSPRARKNGSIRPVMEYYASDTSLEALAAAKQNAKKHGVRINFKIGSLLKPWKNGRFDVIIANLPYLSRINKTIQHEPKQALVAEKKGLALYKGLFGQAALFGHDKRPRLIAIEIDPGQKRQIKKLAADLLPTYAIRFKKDLANKTRLLILSLFHRERHP